MVCPYCSNGPFTSYQYLNHHITYKDPNRKPVKKPETEAFNIQEFSSKKMHSKTSAATVTNSDSKVSYPQAATLNFSISASSTGEQNNQGGNAKAAKSRRCSYTLYFKLKVLRELEIANKDNTIKNKYKSVAKKFSVGQSMVCKWKKQRKDLNAEAEKLRTKKRRSGIDGSRTSWTRRLLRKYH